MSTMETIVALWRWLCGWGVSIGIIMFAIWFTSGTWRIFIYKNNKQHPSRSLVLGIVYTILTIGIIIAALFLNGIFI